MEKLAMRTGGAVYAFWCEKECADRHALSLNPASDIPYESRALPGHDDLWFVAPRGTTQGALDADGGALPARLFESMERTEVFIKLAEDHRKTSTGPFWLHCQIWLAIDPLGLDGFGVPDDEYSSWAAMTTHLCEKGSPLNAMACEIRQGYRDWDAGEISEDRAFELATIFRAVPQ